MSVRATTRREQIRRPNGDRVILPGAQDATGLSALAAVSAGADTITGAGRHATQADVMEPAAEARILFDSLKGTGATLSNDALPGGVTLAYGFINLGLGDRRDNSGWGVARCDIDRCDDPQSQAGTAGTASNAELNATDAPAIYTFTTALDRALTNAQADPALTPWALSQAPVRVNMFPTPSSEVAGVPVAWGSTFGASLTNVAAAGFAGSRHMRLTSTAGGFVGVDSDPFGWVEPGQSVTAQIHLKGTAPTARVSLTTTAGGTFVDGAAVALTASWGVVPATVTYTHPVDKPASRLILSVSAVGTTAAQVIDFDAVLVEAGSGAGAYFDPAFGSGNPVLNPGFDAGVTSWAGGSAVLSWLATGGRRGGGAARVTVSASSTNYALNGTAVPVAVGTPFAASMWVKGSRPGVPVRVRLTYTGATAVNATSALTTGDWQLITATAITPAGATAVRLDALVGTPATLVVAGDTLDVDDVTLNVGAQGLLPYIDAAGWALGTETSQTYGYAVNPAGAYSRPVDATAPQLDLPGSKWVHRRTGALTAGDRISSPWGPCTYGLIPGRTFTIAGWLAVTPTAGGTLPALRWVVELALDPGAQGSAVVTVTSAPFSPADVYQRFAAVLTPSIPTGLFGTPVTAVRAHLEVVTPGTVGTAVSIRGAHLYAGADRGDAAGLDAVVLTAPVRWTVDLADADAFLATRVDVHGNDRVSHITAASGFVDYLDTAGQYVHGASAGRLTMRVPDPDAAGLLESVVVLAEEVSGGPGTALSLQTIRVWHEVDATPDIVTLSVDRASDADPSSSTVPIGNYAATTIDLQLDDIEGTWSLFGRRYIDLGHRIEAAVGVTYTNRAEDPLGIDADAAGTPSLAWPTAAFGASPVAPVEADRYGQVPPAPFVGHATAQGSYDSPMRLTVPADEGWSMRGQVWVRYTGDTVPTLYGAALRRYVLPGVGIVCSVDPATVVALPIATAPDVWQLVKVPTIVVPLGSNAVAVSGTFGLSDPARFLELAAPDFERLDPATGDLIEVVETAPAGVFSSTSWDGGTGGAAVQVGGIDVLATSGAAEVESSAQIRTGTTVEAELRDIARTYLDLGSDQVVIVDQGTPLGFAIPAQKVSTQIADLAKVAALTAFTDGAGRFTALLRSEVEPDVVTRYLSDRNLLEASSAIAPDVVKNDVKVTAHPVARTAGATLATVGNSAATDTSAAAWELSGQEVYLPPGNGSVVIEVGWDADAALSGVVVNAVGWFDWQVGQAAPFNVFSVESDGTTTIPYPPGSNWGTTLGGFQSWATATVEVFPTFGRVTLTNRQMDPGPGAYIPPVYAPAVYVDHLEIMGDGLTVTSVSQRFVRAESVEAFGSQPVDVDVRLAQATALLPVVGVDVLDNFSLRDPAGERWLPDLEVKVLADPWRELGDRVLVGDVDSSISGEYRVLSHNLKVDVGAESSMYLRRVPVGVLFAVTDVSLADDGKVTAY